MKLSVLNGVMYVDNLFFCFAEAGNGRTHLQHGSYPVSAQFSHAYDRELPLATGLGWLGDDPAACDIVLGRVRASDALLPCRGHVQRLLALLEAAESRGAATTLVIGP